MSTVFTRLHTTVGATRKAVVKDLVKTWYQQRGSAQRLAEPRDRRDHGYATAREKLTGIKADTVRTET
ncbi:hypothetical protein [Streptomyces nojiriensis]|uniref:hypothetical protein n=1 Tax=Streptomyces nojiriensis TaxID=66374 RepID=UPI0035DC82D1